MTSLLFLNDLLLIPVSKDLLLIQNRYRLVYVLDDTFKHTAGVNVTNNNRIGKLNNLDVSGVNLLLSGDG